MSKRTKHESNLIRNGQSTQLYCQPQRCFHCHHCSFSIFLTVSISSSRNVILLVLPGISGLDKVTISITLESRGASITLLKEIVPIISLLEDSRGFSLIKDRSWPLIIPISGGALNLM